MTTQARIDELRKLIKDNEVAIEFLDEIENDVSKYDDRIFELECDVRDKEREIYDLEDELPDLFDNGEYNLPLGKVKIWSNNLVLKTRLKSYVENVLSI